MRRAYWGLVCLLPTNIISGIGKSVELNNYVAMMGDMMMGMMVMVVKMRRRVDLTAASERRFVFNVERSVEQIERIFT